MLLLPRKIIQIIQLPYYILHCDLATEAKVQKIVDFEVFSVLNTHIRIA